jgi:hypothetical protein
LPLYSRGEDEAPAPIGQEAQPATDRQPRKTAQAVTDRQPDQSIIRQLRMCNAFRSIKSKPAGLLTRRAFLLASGFALADGGTKPRAAAHARIQI